MREAFTFINEFHSSLMLWNYIAAYVIHVKASSSGMPLPLLLLAKLCNRTQYSHANIVLCNASMTVGQRFLLIAARTDRNVFYQLRRRYGHHELYIAKHCMRLFIIIRRYLSCHFAQIRHITSSSSTRNN